MGQTIDTRMLRGLAGPQSFERGETYGAEGRMGDLVECESLRAAHKPKRNLMALLDRARSD